MEVIETGDWKEFDSKLNELREELGAGSSPLLFRGQSDSKFPLTTTLERAGEGRMSFSRYYMLISAVKPAVETLTGKNWDVPEYSIKLEESFRDYDEFARFPSSAVYRYMVYLRHHGFPSPLLDWSYSPYVAAFFAFQASSPGVEKRSIYAFCESPKGFKAWSSGAPRIRRIGPYIRSHPRHFRQQSDYTICGNFDETWHFHPHEEVFARGESQQDLLWKFNLPSKERPEVMESLDQYNLNAFSLFDTEESLMETMWLRQVVLPGTRRR
jgi:hypothetical protein